MDNATENTGKHTPTSEWSIEQSSQPFWYLLRGNRIVASTFGQTGVFAEKELAEEMRDKLNSYSTLKAENERLKELLKRCDSFVPDYYELSEDIKSALTAK